MHVVVTSGDQQADLARSIKAYIERVESIGFFTGYPKTNLVYEPNWVPDRDLRPSEAAELCEQDVYCGGFAYIGGLGHDRPIHTGIQYFRFVPMPTWMYPEIGAIWTTYKVKREFAVLPGRPLKAVTKSMRIKGTKINERFIKDALANKGDTKWPFEEQMAVAVWFSDDFQGGDLEGTSWFVGVNQDETDDEWTTLLYNKVSIDTKGVHQFPSPDAIMVSSTRKVKFCCLLDQTPPDQLFDAEIDENIAVEDCSISPQDFMDKYVKPAIPVKLLGCSKDWPALTKWTSTYILKNQMNAIWSSSLLNSDGTYAFLSSEEAINKLAKPRKPIGLLGALDPKGNLAKDVSDLLREKDVKDLMVNGGRYILMEPKYHFRFSINVNYTSTISTQIKGRKLLALFPVSGIADKKAFTLGCNPECSLDTGLSWFNQVLPNIKRVKFPGGRKVIMAMTHPGETIYIPGHYGSSVYYPEESISLGRAFIPESDVDILDLINRELGDQMMDRLDEDHKDRYFAAKKQQDLYHKYIDDLNCKPIKECYAEQTILKTLDNINRCACHQKRKFKP